MPALKLHVDGPDAEAVAAELEAFSQAQFGDKAKRVQAGPQPQEGQRDGLVLPLLALIVALPAAAVNTMTLADRIKLRERVQPLIALAGRLKAKGTVVRLEAGGGQKDLASMTPDQVIDAASD
jgi:hypothetical protein